MVLLISTASFQFLFCKSLVYEQTLGSKFQFLSINSLISSRTHSHSLSLTYSHSVSFSLSFLFTLSIRTHPLSFRLSFITFLIKSLTHSLSLSLFFSLSLSLSLTLTLSLVVFLETLCTKHSKNMLLLVFPGIFPHYF